MFEKIAKAIKTRTMKKSERGLYLQDKELKDTDFAPGVRFKYVIDNKKRTVTVLQADDGKNTVSRRKIKNGLKPVVDIRDSRVKQALRSSDLIQVTLYKDRLLIEGLTIVEEHQRSEGSSSSSSMIDFIRITDVSESCKVQKRIQLMVNIGNLRNVSGLDVGYAEQQDWYGNNYGFYHGRGGTNCWVDFKKTLKRLAIPLAMVSFFSGAGMLDYAFKTQGYDIVSAYDFNREACETYKYNIGEHIVCADINKLPMELVPKTPLMVGGSPCQLLSNANRHGTRYLDKPESTLIRKLIERIQYNDKCQIFVWENVPQILTAGKGIFKKEIYSELSDFNLTSGVLCASDFGDPQQRERAFIIGSKIGKIELPTPTTSKTMTVREAFSGIDDQLPNQKDFSSPKPFTLARMSHIPPGGNVFDVPVSMRPKSQHSDSYKRLEWDKPAITIPNPRKAVILHPEEDRILSIRECARLFSLPDAYVFRGSLNSMQQQVANGVPLKMASAVAEKIREAIAKFNLAAAGMAV